MKQCAFSYSIRTLKYSNTTILNVQIQIIENGTAADYREEKATEILSQSKVTVTADIKAGEAQATAWGCDLTHDYISINADYRS